MDEKGLGIPDGCGNNGSAGGSQKLQDYVAFMKTFIKYMKG